MNGRKSGGGGRGTCLPHDLEGGGHNIKCPPPPPPPHDFGVGWLLNLNEDPCYIHALRRCGPFFFFFFFACQRGLWCTMGTHVSGKLSKKCWGRKKVSESPPPPPPSPSPRSSAFSGLARLWRLAAFFFLSFFLVREVRTKEKVNLICKADLSDGLNLVNLKVNVLFWS